MKYLILESRLNDLIYGYLTKNYYPDYNWGPELHDFYKKDIDKFGFYDFEINDVSAFTYVGKGRNQLLIKPWVYEKLNDLFGPKWRSVFIKWFQDNSGLSVSTIRDWDRKYFKFGQN